MYQLEKALSDFFAKFPSLPASIRELIVKIAPYAAVISVVLSLPLIMFALGLDVIAAPIAAAGGAWTVLGGGVIGFAFACVTIVLGVLAIPGLFNRTRPGWKYSFWSALVGALQNLLMGNLFGLVIGTGISLYFLFQIRSYYR
jgi:hypothetical protein